MFVMISFLCVRYCLSDNVGIKMMKWYAGLLSSSRFHTTSLPLFCFVYILLLIFLACKLSSNHILILFISLSCSHILVLFIAYSFPSGHCCWVTCVQKMACKIVYKYQNLSQDTETQLYVRHWQSMGWVFILALFPTSGICLLGKH